MKADPSVQLRLLDLQALDTRLTQLAHAKKTLPQIAEAEQARSALTAVSDDLVRAQTHLSDVQREVTRADADVQMVRDRAARDQARLDSGQGTAKDLTALQHELASLARRQDELEEIELEVMERAEEAQTAVARLSAEQGTATARAATLEQARDAALADLDAERAKVEQPRAGMVAEIDDGLIALYERIRANSGIGAAALVQGRCSGCQLQLNPVDLSRIAAAAADEVLRCEECNRILVRTPA